MLVRDVMSTGVVTARTTDSVRSAIIKMLSRHCGAIPVIDDEQNLIGLVALRDVMIPLFPNYGDYIHDTVHSRDFLEMEEGYPEVLRRNLESVMSRNPLTVAPTTTILEAASYMGIKNFRRIPVTEHGKLQGMVSLGDINRGLFFDKGFLNA
ncbi:MAG: CBS domain-containing protein [Nitrospirales bacterium]|nr:MAG: CBS domain-containing protein [Nitrospirales bacterium]